MEDAISRINEIVDGSLGVFVSDGLPSFPLFIIFRIKSKKIEAYNGFYLTASVGRMPFLKWQSEIKYSDKPSFESENWNIFGRACVDAVLSSPHQRRPGSDNVIC